MLMIISIEDAACFTTCNSNGSLSGKGVSRLLFVAYHDTILSVKTAGLGNISYARPMLGLFSIYVFLVSGTSHTYIFDGHLICIRSGTRVSHKFDHSLILMLQITVQSFPGLLACYSIACSSLLGMLLVCQPILNTSGRPWPVLQETFTRRTTHELTH